MTFRLAVIILKKSHTMHLERILVKHLFILFIWYALFFAQEENRNKLRLPKEVWPNPSNVVFFPVKLISLTSASGKQI